MRDTTLAPLPGVTLVWISQSGTVKNARLAAEQLEIGRHRKETFQTLRWAADYAIQIDDIERSLMGIAVLGGIVNADQALYGDADKYPHSVMMKGIVLATRGAI